jgi:hypothetical protein
MKVFRRVPGSTVAAPARSSRPPQPPRPPRRPARQDLPALLAFLAGAGILASTAALGMAQASPAGASAMVSNTTSPSPTAGLGTVLNGITKSSNETFSATYQIVNPTSKENVTVTFAQSAGKEAVLTSKGSFYITSSSVTVCEGAGDKSCTKLPTALVGPALTSVDALKELFSPGVIVNNLKGIKGIMATHPHGYSASTSSQTYDRLGSTCIHLSGAKLSAPVTYCAANSSGVLDHAQSNGNSITMTAFTQHPATSSFSPPAGAKVVTVSKLP